ncbi:MAG TPA: ABC transporter permease [Acidobacteriota bacterium]
MSAGDLSERLYGALIRLYPPAFRRRYAADMLGHFRQRRDELRGRPLPLRVLSLAAEIGLDLIVSLPREYLAASLTALAHFGRDLRLAMRLLRQRPSFSLTVIVTLALAIGANAAVFSLVNGVLIAPLPYREPDRLAWLYLRNSSTFRLTLSVADWNGLREQHESFASIAALRIAELAATGAERPEHVRAARVTAGFFETFGVQAARGRTFLEGEDEVGAPPVAVLGHAFAERYFGAGIDPIGRPVTLDGVPHTVVGVLAPGVERVVYGAEAWVPLPMPTPSRRGPFGLQVFARLADGRTLEHAAAELETVSRGLFTQWASSFQDEEARLTPYPLREIVLGDTGRRLALVFGAVALVLLVAIANVANLMLARASSRRRELVVRAALGASPERLASAVLAEGLVLSAAGGLGGLAIAAVAVRGFRATGLSVPRLAEVGVDLRAVAFVAAIVVASTLLLAAAQLLFGFGRTAASMGVARTATASPSTRRFQGSLIALEFALTVPLLVAAGLLLNSFARLQAVDPGFDPGGVVAATISLPEQRYPELGNLVSFWEQLEQDVLEVPGVIAVGAVAGLPPDTFGATNNFDLIDKPVPSGASQPQAPWSAADPGFLAALGVPLIEGRWFTDADADGPPVLVVTQDWAERYYPDESALGKQLVSGGCYACEPNTIVGVIGDLKYDGLTSHGEVVFEPATGRWLRSLSLVVRTAGRPETVIAPLRERLRAIDPELPVQVATMEERLSAAVAEPRQWTILLGVFAALTALMSALGVSGVLAYHVRRQVREIGVRKALGAGDAELVRFVVGRGMFLVGAGSAAGLALSLYVARWIEPFLFQVSATDPLTLAAVSGLLALVALGACYLPGRRAAKVDPVEALLTD